MNQFPDSLLSGHPEKASPNSFLCPSPSPRPYLTSPKQKSSLLICQSVFSVVMAHIVIRNSSFVEALVILIKHSIFQSRKWFQFRCRKIIHRLIKHPQNIITYSVSLVSCISWSYSKYFFIFIHFPHLIF